MDEKFRIEQHRFLGKNIINADKQQSYGGNFQFKWLKTCKKSNVQLLH